MTVRIIGAKVENCGTAFLVHGNSDVEVQQPEIINCGIGVAQFTTEKELEVILQKSKEHFEEIIALTKELKNTKPELRKGLLFSSAVFSTLAVGSNASTVFEFLINHFPEIAQLLS